MRVGTAAQRSGCMNKMKSAKIRIKPPGGAFPGVDSTLAETPGVERESVLYFEYMEDGCLSLVYRLGAEDTEAVTTALDRDDTVLNHEVVEMAGGTIYLFIHAERSDLMAELISVVEDNAVVVTGPYRWTDEGFEARIAGTTEALQQAHEQASKNFEVTIDWIGRYSPGVATPLDRLTDRQREALETAHQQGFYELPRRTSYEEIGMELGCTPSSANDLLRRAEASVMQALFEE